MGGDALAAVEHFNVRAVMLSRGSPNSALHTLHTLSTAHRTGRDRSEQVVVIDWNGWSSSIGTPGCHQPARADLQRYDELMDAADAAVELVRAGRLDDAEAAARDLLAPFPDEHDGWDRRGMVHKARGENGQAAACYRRVLDVIRQRPHDYDAAFDEKFVNLDRQARTRQRRAERTARAIVLAEDADHRTIASRDRTAPIQRSSSVVGLGVTRWTQEASLDNK